MSEEDQIDLSNYCTTCSFNEGIIPNFHPTLNDPYATDFAALVPRFTGSLSFLGSALIVYVILTSGQKLSTTYHRLMFGMSITDMIGSLAMSLTSLPMPKSMPYEKEFGYHWAGTRLGNTITCNIQGFMFTIGTTSMFAYNGFLCVYYACAIGFMMRERNIRKYVEPFLHGFPILLGLTYGIIPLFLDMYNPSGLVAFCSAISYPYSCYKGDSCNVRGSKGYFDHISKMLVTITFAFLAMIIISFGFVIYRALKLDRQISILNDAVIKDDGDEARDASASAGDGAAGANDNDEGHEVRGSNSRDGTSAANDNDEEEKKSHPIVGNVLDKRHHMKIVIKQALGYICALFITLIFPILRLSGTMPEQEVLFDKLGLVFTPLQGFFNFTIFILHKVYNYRRVNPDVSRRQVLYKIFFTTFQEPVFMSRISIVEREFVSSVEEDFEDDKKGDGNVFQIDLDDEAGDLSSYLLSYNEEENEVEVLSYPSKISRDVSAGDDVLLDHSESNGDLSGFDFNDGVSSFLPSVIPSHVSSFYGRRRRNLFWTRRRSDEVE